MVKNVERPAAEEPHIILILFSGVDGDEAEAIGLFGFLTWTQTSLRGL